MKRKEKQETEKIVIKAIEGPGLLPNAEPWPYQKKKDAVCICGTASTLANTPWEEVNDFEFWACSPVVTYPEVKNHRFDLLFELHGAEYWGNEAVKTRLIEYDAPLYMIEKTPDIPSSLTFPLKRIQAMVNNGYLNKYFTSTISYMIALAICMGYKRIELFGIHMAASEEYGDQRQACEAWMAYAAGLGIDMYIPGQSELFRCPYLYGYENENSVKIQARTRKEGLRLGVEQLRGERKKIVAQLRQLDKDISENVGAAKDCEYFERRYT